MITPHKYLDLNLSVLNLGGLILTELRRKGIIKYDELLDNVILARGQNAKDVFLPSLNFLYLLGKVEYRQDIDSLEYIE